MVIVALFSWWYSVGWQRLAARSGERIRGMLETFSVTLLLGTLFDPFHQISAGQVQGSMQVQLRAWADRSFSRVFGAFIRTFVILIGCFAAFFAMVFGSIELIVWPFVPVLPLIGLVLFVIGWKL